MTVNVLHCRPDVAGDPYDLLPTERARVRTAQLPARLKVVVRAGPDRGRELELRAGTSAIGKAASCELALTDTSVSRRHLEVALFPDCVELRDLGSTNGSHYRGACFDRLRVGAGAVITIGETELAVVAAAPALPPGVRAFGDVIATSARMCAVFDVLEKVAASDATVLLQGETGTGKELVAAAIHAASPRRDAPLAVCDLGAVAHGVIESELFGHVRGAFTGAEQGREGVFARASGGTLFLDEVGELAREAQPLLLRALDSREIRPLGSTRYQPVDLRIVAATHSDLAADVAAGEFREDLYHRLCVVRVELPPLRERPEDIPVLVERLLATFRPPRPHVSAKTLAALAAHDWPGNVRELRNVLERAAALAEGRDLEPELLGLAPAPHTGELSFRDAKERLVVAWERDYLTVLLRRARGNVSRAARLAGLDRPYLHRLLKKHGVSG